MADFLIKNTPGNTPSAAGGNVDPFTSAGAYRPAAPAATGASAAGNADPFTSGGAYKPGAAPAGVPTCGGGSAPVDPWMQGAYTTAQGAAARAAASAPATAYASFTTAKHDAVLAKLLEFSAQLREGGEPEIALSAAEATAVTDLVGELRAGRLSPGVVRAGLAALVGADGRPGALGWPAAQLFPVLDVLRLALLHAPSEAVATAQPALVPRLAALLAPGSAVTADKAAPLMLLRGLANVLANPQTRELAAPHACVMLDAASQYLGGSGSAQLRLAACTVLLNASSLLKEPRPPADPQPLALQVVTLAALALSSAPALATKPEEEALYRLLCALTPVLEAGGGAAEAAHDLGVPSALTSLPLAADAAAKVRHKVADAQAALAKRSKQ